jgi:hypothetical protein
LTPKEILRGKNILLLTLLLKMCYLKESLFKDGASYC